MTGRRNALSLIGLIGLVGLVCVASLAIGAKTTNPLDVLRAVFGQGDAVVESLIAARTTRTILGLIVGVCAGLSGTLLQGVTRNPIAEPGLLGLTAGGSMMVVVGLTLGFDQPLAMAALSFVGVALAAAIVLTIGLRTPKARQALTMLLTGAAVMATSGSVISALLLVNTESLDMLRHWQVGSVSGVGLARLPGVAAFLAVGLVLAFISAKGLDALSLGDDVAHALGHDVVRQRLVIMLAVVALTASATALAGPIAAVGLVAPHAVRRLVGNAHLPLLAGSALAGAALVVIADTLGRVIMPPSEVSVGIMTAIIGAPVLLAVARKAVRA